MRQEIAYALILLCLMAGGILLWRLLRRRPPERHLRIDLFQSREP